MPDDATVEILLKWKQDGEQVVAQVQAQLAGLTVQTQAATAATSAASAAAGGGTPAWLGMAVAITAAVAALSPFIILVGSAAVIVTTFAIAGAATLTLLGGLALGFGAVGAAILMLGGGGGVGAAAALTTASNQLFVAQQNVIDLQQKIAAQGFPATLSQRQQMEDLVRSQGLAQQKYNDALTASQGPTGVLIGQLTAMRDALAAQAAPLALIITQWAGGALPAVQALGGALITWFGDRLPGVLTGIGKIVQDLTPTFSQFGQFVGSTMDKVFGMTTIGSGGTIVTMGQLFTQAIQGMMGGLQGFIGLLTQLTQWFLERLPAYGPIVNQVFGFLGNVILGVFQVWGRFADWLVGQWPAITDLASRAIRSINEQWTLLKPQWDEFVSKMGPALGGMLKYVADNAGSIVPVVLGAIVVFSQLSLVALALVGTIGMIITKFTELSNTITGWKNGALNDIGAVQNALDKLLGTGGGPNPSQYNRYGTGSYQRGFRTA